MARPRGFERNEVIDKAMELFWRQGYEGAHLAALVDHTGLNRFSLYKEFGGKAGLYEAALERLTREVAAVAGGDEVAAAKQVDEVLVSRAA